MKKILAYFLLLASVAGCRTSNSSTPASSDLMETGTAKNDSFSEEDSKLIIEALKASNIRGVTDTRRRSATTWELRSLDCIEKVREVAGAPRPGTFPSRIRRSCTTSVNDRAPEAFTKSASDDIIDMLLRKRIPAVTNLRLQQKSWALKNISCVQLSAELPGSDGSDLSTQLIYECSARN